MLRLLLLTLLVSSMAAAQSDPLPVRFLPGGARVEGCVSQWSTRSAIQAYSAPTTMSTQTRVIDADRRIDANDYSESLTAVLEPGIVRTTAPVEVFGARLSGDESATFTVPSGREILILAYGPEESVFFEYRGRVYSGLVPGYLGSDSTELVSRPVTELWVRLVAYSSERPAAWVNTAQAGMAPREGFCQ